MRAAQIPYHFPEPPRRRRGDGRPSSCRSAPGRSRATEPIVDRRAKPVLGDRRDRNPRCSGGVQGAQIGKQMRRGLDEVSGGRKIEARGWRGVFQRSAKIERGFVHPGVKGAEAKLSLGRIVRRQLPRRIRRRSRRARRTRSANRARIRSPLVLSPRRAAVGVDRQDSRRSSISRPWRQGPPSRIQSILPSRSATT